MDWKRIKSEYLLKSKFLNLRHDVCEMPSGKIVDPYYILEISDWVNVVAVNENNEVLLVKQYRHAMGKTLLGLPSGFIENDETPFEAAKRELAEETGYVSDNFSKLVSLSPNPALQDNLVHSFLAMDIKKVGSQKLDEFEDIEIEFHPIENIKTMLSEQKIANALYAAAFMFAFDKLNLS